MRLVCKRLNTAITRFLFREVRIQLGWDGLSINPPLGEIVLEESGRVFRENARVLKINLCNLSKSLTFTHDDTSRDGNPLMARALSPGAWYHFPEPLCQVEKNRRYQELIQEVEDKLPAAIAAMNGVIEIQ